MEKNINSVLSMDKLIFDEINFERIGFKKDSSEFDFNIEVLIGFNTKLGTYKVTIKMLGEKSEEYRLNIALTGFFSFNGGEDVIGDIPKSELIEKNAVAIMMPYLRSQVSLITAQPNVDCVILQPFNINSMLSTD
ncbi:MAG: Preprotein translocase subunit SecB [Eubacteriales bacterium]